MLLKYLKAIDKDYEEKPFYSYDTSTKDFLMMKFLDMILSYEPDLKEVVVKEEMDFEKHLEDEIEQVQSRTDLKEIEKRAWVNNFNIMKKYRIQRAINKIYYIHCIKQISEVIKREKIKEIDTPFYEKYWHVLQTIQGSLSSGRDSYGSDLKVESDENTMVAKLFVKY